MAKNINLKVTTSGKYIKVAGNKIELNKTFQDKIKDQKLLVKDEMEIAKKVVHHIKKNISSGKRYDTGGNVKKLADSTIKAKGSSIPLIDSGKLLSGVIAKRENGQTVVRMKETTYQKGTKLSDVAQWINEGTDRMPSRPAIGINKTNASKIVNEVLKNKFK